ncbi:glycerol-3-phosphate ABC transporter [Vibrio ishigakensis]|uniref:Glycerol-3-phosphate ABC transporter n=1 Tax=Vibrio ishigakensis TaxID=1481914 RepID=A0A0B8Q7X9_9VIBR|nr:glycerol-3-phosphate ABC transporter [Vibrio ishigakensis]
MGMKMKKLTVIATAIATTLSASAFAAPYGDSPSVAFTGTKRFDISYHDQNNGRMIHDTIDLTATQAANFAHAVSRGEGAYKDGTIALHRSSAPQMKTPVAQPHMVPHPLPQPATVPAPMMKAPVAQPHMVPHPVPQPATVPAPMIKAPVAQHTWCRIQCPSLQLCLRL